MRDAGSVDGNNLADRRAGLWRLTAEGSHDGLGDFLDDAFLAAHKARLVTVTSQGPQVHPPDGLGGEGLGVRLVEGGDVGPELRLSVDMA